MIIFSRLYLNSSKKNNDIYNIRTIFHNCGCRNIALKEIHAFITDTVDNDNNYDIVYNFVIYILENYLDFSDLITTKNNYKDILIYYMQHHLQDVPKFLEIDITGLTPFKSYKWLFIFENFFHVKLSETIKVSQDFISFFFFNIFVNSLSDNSNRSLIL